MKTKKILFAALLLATLVACQTPGNTYYIEGIIDDEMEGREIYLTDYVTDVRIDTAVVRDGMFRFAGVVDTPFFAVIEEGSYYFPLIVEPADTLFADMMEYMPATGAPLNDALNAYDDRNRELFDVYQTEVDSIMRLADERKIGRREALDSLNEKEREISRLFDENVWSTIQEHPDDIVGAIAFRRWLTNKERDLAAIDSVAGRVPATLLAYPIVKEELDIIRYKSLSAVGMPFIDFTVESDSGSVSLSDFVGQGRPVLALFWGSWDDAAPREVREIYRRYNGKGLSGVGIALWDDPADSREAIADKEIPWRQILGAREKPADLYAINDLPYTILFAADGTIVARGLKGASLSREIARAVSVTTQK